MATPVFGFNQYEDSESIDEIETLFNDGFQSVEDNLPHRFVATISDLNGLTGSMHPAGQIAILTADSSGVKAGAIFTRAASKWHFTSGQISNLATFVGALTSNVATAPGASFYDIGAGLAKVFISATGDWLITAPIPLYAMALHTSSTQQITTTATAVSFQSLKEGSDTSFWNGAAPANITIPEDGRYLLSAQLRVNSGYIETALSFSVNDSLDPNFIASAGDRATVAWPTCRGTIELDLLAGDVVKLLCNRYGGSNAAITPDATWLQIRKLQ